MSIQIGRHDKMGMNVVPLKELPPNEAKVMTLDLLKNMDPNDVHNDKMRGLIEVELTYKPFKEEDMPNNTENVGVVQKAPEGTPSAGGLLVVTVHEAKDVEGKHHTNPYVRINFKGEERKTKVYRNFFFCSCRIMCICLKRFLYTILVRTLNWNYLF